MHDTASESGLQSSPIRRIVWAHAALLLVSLLLYRVFPDSLIMQVISPGVVGAQTMLLAIWLYLGGGPKFRGLLGAAAFVTLIAAVHTPNVLRVPFILWLTLGPSLAGLGIALLSAPLAIIRVEGLRLKRFHPGRLPPDRRLQFTMFHLLWIMATIAALFGLGQVARSGELGRGILWPVQSFALLAMVLVVASILTTVPLVCVWAMLTPGPVLPRLAVTALGWGLGGLVIGEYCRPLTDSALLPLVVTIVAVAVLLATLAVLRRSGYRVVWRALGER